MEEAQILLARGKYKGANNRAYYPIFHAIKAIIALEQIDFKKHSSVIAYFNKNYINTEIFPKSMGRRIINANTIREDSDYDDEFVVNSSKTKEQLETAKELIKLVENYLIEK